MNNNTKKEMSRLSSKTLTISKLKKLIDKINELDSDAKLSKSGKKFVIANTIVNYF